MRMDGEQYSRLRSAVDSGRIACGSWAHLALIDFEEEIQTLPPRDKKIIEMALIGWSHGTIADEVGLSRSRVAHLVEDFFLSVTLT